MTLLIKDRVQEVTTSSGTGPILLGTSFIAGYVDIGTAIGNGNTTPYVITDTTNNVYEIGVGQYILANTSLLRLQVLASSNANALVNFAAGAKNIFVDVPAAYISLTVRGLNQFASTTSANLASIISDAVGTGPLVFANNAVFVTPTLGVATGTSLTLSTALPITSGGTNSTATPTAGGIGYGTGTAHAYNAVGTSGQVLTSAGAGVPTWTSTASININGTVGATTPAAVTGTIITAADQTAFKETTSVFPTIRPTLNLDFANSGIVDPRITFARATTATYYDGKTTAMAEQNSLLQSNTFSNATWVATNGTVASGVTDPAGTTTAFSFTATGVATLYQTLTTTATPYTLSFYIQRVTGTGAVNLTLDGTTLTAQTITGSWARYSVTATPTGASHTIGLQLAVSGDVVNIFSSQLENRSSMTAANITTTAVITNYIPVLMTANAGVPRLDYNPVTGRALGLLIEEQRVNLLLYSSTFTNAAWSLTNATLTAAATIAPDGTQTAFNLVSNTATGLQAIAQTVTKAASALAYTSTVHFKANQYTYSWLQISDGAGNGAIVYFNLTTGAISTAVAGVGTAFTALSATTPVSIGNGWYRCNITGTSNTATSLVTQFGSSTNGTSNSVVGNGYSGVFIWGAQAE